MGGNKIIKAPTLYKVLFILTILLSFVLYLLVSRYLYIIGVLAIILDGVLQFNVFGRKILDPFFKVIVPFRCWTLEGWYSLERGHRLHALEVFDEMPIEGSEYTCDSGKVLKVNRRSFAQIVVDGKDVVIGLDTLNTCCARKDKWYDRLS